MTRAQSTLLDVKVMRIEWRCPTCDAPLWTDTKEQKEFEYTCDDCYSPHWVILPDLMPCKHTDDVSWGRLHYFLDDVYYCKCGSLISLSNEHNLKPDQKEYFPMTIIEINNAIENILFDFKKKLKNSYDDIFRGAVQRYTDEDL